MIMIILVSELQLTKLWTAFVTTRRVLNCIGKGILFFGRQEKRQCTFANIFDSSVQICLILYLYTLKIAWLPGAKSPPPGPHASFAALGERASTPPPWPHPAPWHRRQETHGFHYGLTVTLEKNNWMKNVSRPQFAIQHVQFPLPTLQQLNIQSCSV